MRILLVSQIVPSPPDAGPRIKTGHVIRYLAARGHAVTLVAFARPEERPHLAALSESCAAVHPVPLARSRRRDLVAWLRSHRTGRPFLVERDDEPAMRATVARLLGSGTFDAVHADQLPMTQFVTEHGPADLLSVYDSHNAMWRVAERLRGVVPVHLRPALALEARRLRRYEGATVRRFDRTLAVTEADARDLRAAGSVAAGAAAAPAGGPGDRITVVPIGIDTDALRPGPRTSGATEILMLGA